MKAKENFLQKKSAALLMALFMVMLIASCKKNNIDDTAQPKGASFTITASNATFAGTEISDDSYMTATDEFIEGPYTELHLGGTNVKLDVMFANPSVKQYAFSSTNDEAAVVLSANNTVYSPSSNVIVTITKLGSNNISGTITGTFKDVNGGADLIITNGNFTVQF